MFLEFQHDIALPTSTTFRLQPADEDDREFICSLRVATMKRLVIDTYGWDEAVQRFYTDESFAGRIVLVDGQPVGVVTLKDREQEIQSSWIALVADVQGRALGRALVR